MTQAAALALDAIAAPAARVRPRDLASLSGLDAQRAINQNGLSRTGGDQIADSVRAHMASLLTLERKVKPVGPGAVGGVDVTVLGGKDPEGTQLLGGNQKASEGDAALGNLKDAFEYATNAALVSLVLTGVTSSITTLTTRGG